EPGSRDASGHEEQENRLHVPHPAVLHFTFWRHAVASPAGTRGTPICSHTQLSPQSPTTNATKKWTIPQVLGAPRSGGTPRFQLPESRPYGRSHKGWLLSVFETGTGCPVFASPLSRATLPQNRFCTQVAQWRENVRVAPSLGIPAH